MCAWISALCRGWAPQSADDTDLQAKGGSGVFGSDGCKWSGQWISFYQTNGHGKPGSVGSWWKQLSRVQQHAQPEQFWLLCVYARKFLSHKGPCHPSAVSMVQCGLAALHNLRTDPTPCHGVWLVEWQACLRGEGNRHLWACQISDVCRRTSSGARWCRLWHPHTGIKWNKYLITSGNHKNLIRWHIDVSANLENFQAALRRTTRKRFARVFSVCNSRVLLVLVIVKLVTGPL